MRQKYLLVIRYQGERVLQAHSLYTKPAFSVEPLSSTFSISHSAPSLLITGRVINQAPPHAGLRQTIFLQAPYIWERSFELAAEVNSSFLSGFCCLNNYRHFVRSCCVTPPFPHLQVPLSCEQDYHYPFLFQRKIRDFPVGKQPRKWSFPALTTSDQQPGRRGFACYKTRRCSDCPVLSTGFALRLSHLQCL